MKKKYTQPYCTVISVITTITMLVSSPNRVSESGEEVTTDGESGTGDAGGAHAKSWNYGWYEEEE